ncbi:MAG: hypothetical protein KC613_19195 [Myxococcales bacterium]|nr:hypothetical protein [Myxococcales bacterium]
MRALQIALLSLLPLALHAAPPGQQPELTAAHLLGAIDVPLSAALLARFSLDRPALETFLADGKQARYVRLRALNGLGILGTAQARDRVAQALRADADEAVRAEAVVVLARAWAQRGDALALVALQESQAKQPPVRVARTLEEELARLATP